MATIHLVDDSAVELVRLRNCLKEHGYVVRVSDNAKDALETIIESPPDLLVSDIMMPEMDGVELCHHLRKRFRKNQELPILLVSSLDTMEDMVRGYEAGADDYLVKPPRLDEFLMKVSILLGQRRDFLSKTRRMELLTKRREDPELRPRFNRSSEPELDDPFAGSDFIDRYEILELLGEGAYGSVYKARRLGADEIVALKVLSRSKAARKSAVARFLGEQDVLRQLGPQQGIAQLHDVGYDGTSYFIAMDLVRGETLRERLARVSPLPEAEAAGLVRQVATTLRRVWKKKVVHRDIKPGNIMITGSGEAVLIDFGLASLTDGDRTTDKHAVPGTPHYLPPELLKKGEKGLDIRGDLYSLGVTLFELLTGALPYVGLNGPELLMAKVNGAQPELSPLVERSITPGLIAVLERAMAWHPDARFQTPEELERALAPYARS